MSFRVGQEVQCIAEHWFLSQGRWPKSKGPAKGEVLRIAETKVRGVEQYLGFREWPGERFYNAIGFRPLVKRKTDISIFKKMLNTKPAKERARA